MRKRPMFALGLSSLTLYSYQNEVASIQETVTQPQSTSFNDVASFLTTLPMTNEIYKEVHQAVETSLNFGLDEDYRFKFQDIGFSINTGDLACGIGGTALISGRDLHNQPYSSAIDIFKSENLKHIYKYGLTMKSG